MTATRSSSSNRQSAFDVATLQTRRSVLLWGASLVCFGSLCLAGKSIANPMGEKLRSGSAAFTREGDNLLIRQDSQKLIIDWKEFSIANGELTRFLQPGSDSAALNRVFGGNPSSIYGALQGNGKIFLINPNGVFIGPSGRVDAGSFIASTLDTSDEEFLKGGNLSFSGKSEASVVNLGTITALDGDVYLVAKSVENHGSIDAPNGTAGLVGGTEVMLQPAGEEKMGVSLTSGPGKVINTGKIAAAQAELKAAGGNLYALAIQNSGNVRATGVQRAAGRVVLRANSGKIENSGRLEAKNLNRSGGRIVLGPGNKPDGSPGSKSGVRVVNSGVVDASGTTGGSVAIFAEDVLLSPSSQVLAAGTAGAGGTVSVDASASIADSSGSVVNASGTTGGSILYTAGEALGISGTFLAQGTTGAGGSLALRAPGVTIDAALLDASGSSGGSIDITGDSILVQETAGLRADGDFAGGRIVAFAERDMEFHGQISARAVAEGAPGGFAEVSGLTSLIYDGTADLRSVNGSTGTLLLDPTNFTIDAATAASITGNLLTSNVVISTASAGAGAGDIFVRSPILYSSANNLSLLAHRHIEVEASIQNAGAGALNLVAGWNGVTGLGVPGLSFTTFTSSPSSYGNNGGSVFVRAGAESVSVGSRFGATNAAGFHLAVEGSNGGNSASAQLGFRAPVGVPGFNIDGSIQLELKGNLTVAGGDSNFTYAQIGHGGPSSAGNLDGAITINTAGNTSVVGGANFSYAQIGHGGDGSGGSQNGEITVRTSNLSIIGGTKPQSNAQLGHGDPSGGGSSIRTGSIFIQARGETSLVNGPGNNAIWQIGHGAGTPANVTDSSVFFSTGALDYSSSVTATQTTISQDFVDKFSRNLLSGDVTIWGTGGGAVLVNGAFDYNTPNRLTILADGSATVNASIVNRGTGEVVLAVDAINSNRPALNPSATLTIAGTATLSSGGAVRVFSVSPATTNLGAFTPAARRYNVWFGDAITASGVNYKFQPTLTLTANNFTKAYGDILTFQGSQYTFSGLQPGDTLTQILSGNVGLFSDGNTATAGVAGSPYPVTFAAGLSTGMGYGLQLINGTLAVTPAPLNLRSLDQVKVYGTTLAFTGSEFSATGLKNGETVGLVSLSSTGAVATANVAGSPYAIAISNASGGTFNPANYSLSFAQGALTVTPAGLTITASNRSKEYGNLLSFAGTEFIGSGLLNSDSISGVGLSSAGALATAGVAGSPYAITASNATGSGLANYTISYLPGALTVTQAPLSLRALDQGKLYGSTFTFTGSEFAATGLKNGESVGLVSLSSTGAVATANVAGSPYAIAISNASGGTFNPANYSLSFVQGALTVTPAGLTITASNRSEEYGNLLSFAGTEFISSGLLNSDTIGSVSLSSPGTLATAGVAGSPYAITASNATGSGLANYTISYLPGALSVTPAPLSLQALDQGKVYGTTFAFTGSEFAATGLKNGESVGLVSLSSTGAVATANVAGSPYAIAISNASGGTFNPANYSLSFVQGALTVTPAGLTVTASNRSKEYGNLLSFAGTEFISSGLLNSDTISGVSLSSAGALATAGVAGSPYAITASNAAGSGLANYTISYLPGALSVTPAPLSLRALDQAKVYGSTFTFTGSEFAATGLKNGESVGLVSLSSTGAVATANVAGSPYAIAISNASGGTFNPANYSLSFVQGALTVTPAGLTITASNRSKQYGNLLSFAGTEFISSGLLNSDSISGVGLSSAGALATAGVAGSPYAITASNATGSGLANYTISYLPGALSVTPAPLSLLALDQGKVYGSTFTFTGSEFAATGLKNGESVGLVSLSSTGSAATANVAGSPYAIAISNASGGTFNPANYSLSFVQGALTVTPAGLTITAGNQGKEYGNLLSFAGTEFTSSGLLNSDTIGSVSLSSPGALATAGVVGSPYAINASNATGSGLANYTISYLPGTLSVTPAPLSLRALDQGKVYGTTFTFTGSEFSATGLKNGESVGLVSLSSTGAVATANVAGSPYAIAISNASGGTFNPANYSLSFVQGALNVTPAGLTITASNRSKEYGNLVSFAGTEFTSSGLLNSDTIGGVILSSPGTLATAGVAGSPYSITASNATGSGLGNYTISYLPGALSVTRAPLSLQALDQGKAYGTTLTFTGSEFAATGLKNGESVGLVSLSSTGAVATASVAGSPYAIAISNASGGTFNPANYSLSFVQGALTVTPAGLTITASNQGKEYGNVLTFAGTEFISSGLLNSDSIGGVSLSSSGTLTTAGVAGSPYAITASNATGSGLANYTISYLSGALSVTPALLSLRALDQGKVYGSTFTFTGSEFAATGLKNGESVHLVSLASTGAVATASVAGSPHAIAISNARGGTFNPANYSLSFVQGALTVTPAGLTITANNRSKVYGNLLSFSGTEFTSSGLRNNDLISGLSLSSPGTLTTAGVAGSPYAITASNATGSGLANYTISYLPGALSVTPAPLSLRALDQGKVYGTTLTFTGSEFAATGLKNGESVGLVSLSSTGAVATANVAGSPYAIAISNASGGSFNPANYSLSFVQGALNVTPAGLTITASNRSKEYGNLLSFAGTEFISSGLLNSDTIGSVSLSSPGALATAGVTGSPYAITASNATGSGLANYTISYLPGALSVTSAPLSLRALDQGKVYGSTFTFAGSEFSATGLKNGESVGLVSLSSTGAVATANVAGSPYAIAISNASGGTFNPANYSLSFVQGALTVTPAGLTITASNRSKEYGNLLSFAGTEFISSGLLNSDTIGSVSLSSAGTVATAGVAGSPYAITAGNATGSGLANYAISYLPGALSVTPAPLSLRALDQGKVYGSTFTFAGSEFAATGLKNGESVGLVNLSSTGAVATANVAGSPYAIAISNASGGTFNPANYSLSFVQGALTVTPAGLTITASNQGKDYGNLLTFAGTEFISSGLLNSDTISGVGLSSAGALATAGVAGSPYAITASNATGSGLANYTISYLPGALSVTPAPLSLRALDQGKVYGSTFTFAGSEFSATGLKNGESVGLVSLSSTGAAATANVAGSPYAIAISNASGGTFNPANYSLSFVQGALTVTPAGLTITASNQGKEYGNLLTFAGTEFTSSGLLNSDTIGGVSLSSPGTLATAGVAGSPYAITASNATGSGLANYTISYLPGALSVTPAPLSLRALDQGKVYGSTFTFTGSEFAATGLKNGESVGLVSLSSTGAVATANVAGSPYAIAISNASGGTFNPANYSLSFVPGALTVTPAGLTITASNQGKEYGNLLSFAGTEFISSGLLNSDSIGGVSLSSPGALATAGVAGSPYAITASNATGSGLGNYTISYLPGTLSVTPAPLSLRALDQGKVYGSTFTFAGSEFAATGLKNGESVGLVSLSSTGAGATANVAGSPYAITISIATGGSFDPANYSLSFVQGALTITPAALAITPSNQVKEYGSLLTFTGSEFTSSGLLNSDAISGVSLSSPGTLATAGVAGSPYAVTASDATGSGLGNYIISYLPGALNVTPAPLSLRALDRAKVYGNTLIFSGSEFAATGLKNGERVGLVTLSSTGTIPTAGVAAGPYGITISNARGGTFDPGNYTLTFINGRLAVTPASLTITPGDQTKDNGITLNLDGTRFTASGLRNGETVGLVTLSSNGAQGSANAGSYQISATAARGGTFNATNYSITYAGGTLIVLASPPILQPPANPVPGVKEVRDLVSLDQGNNLPNPGTLEPPDDDGSVISGFGIVRLNDNAFFGEQLVEPGGALFMDASGVSPLLPIGEAPQNLEEDLAEKPHDALKEAIAEDDRQTGGGRTRYYEVNSGEVLSADAIGKVRFEQLGTGPSILRQATDVETEMQLIRAAQW